MEIPLTKLRELYSFLKLFRQDTQISILKDFNRANNYTKLITIFEESKKHFNKYCCIDPFISSNKRKTLPAPSTTKISDTNGMVSILESRSKTEDKAVIVINNTKLNFKYIEREISPYRTPGNSIFENGKSGRSSGLGGLDFIGINDIDNLPILGEIKIKTDENLFYALIQLLTYLSELTTPNQIKRLNYTKLFGDKHAIKGKFYLYILLSGYSNNPEAQKLLKGSMKLAKNLQSNIKEIKEIIFLKLDKPNIDIEQINEL